MKMNKALSIFSGAALALSMVVTAMPAFAEVGVNTNINAQVHMDGSGKMQGEIDGKMGGRMGDERGRGPGMMKPGVMGKVIAVSGTTLTLTGRQMGPNTTASTTFTIDASGAVIMKNNATSTLSAITINDTVFVEGTVTGTNVVATTIHDGVFGRGNGQPWGDKDHMMASSTMMGNGQPVVAGKVTAVSGSSITITNSSNVSYTIDASSAKILAGKDASTLSTIQVGDTLLIQGTTTGSSIVASTVIDQANRGNSANNRPQGHGFFQSIGNFFSRLFGF